MCTHRSGEFPCRSTVRQIGPIFNQTKEHNHTGNLEIGDHVRVRKNVKAKALDNHFQSAKALVEDIFISYKQDNPTCSLPDEANIVRVANRARENIVLQIPEIVILS